MPIFRNKEKRYFLITSYKVLFSGLTRQSELIPILFTVEQFNLRTYFHIVRHLKWPVYMFVRNPYDRILSLFADKFVKQPARIGEKDFEWQAFHKVFYKHLGLSVTQSDNELAEAFQRFDINAFIGLLPEVYLMDDHMIPQYRSIWAQAVNGVRLKLPFVSVLQFEDDLEEAGGMLGLDLRHRYNVSNSFEYRDKLTPDSIDIINRLYHKDFVLGGYVEKQAQK
ncbi:MAG: hypothetical protein GF392_03320 [Candidatus Omnitrophica bacterium]|nr:hypothetical protein [Candidatus Omnitrophota bacterium]